MKENEKQVIEEMSAVIASAIEFDELDFGMDEKTEIIAMKAAEKFYAEGYRMQSEGEWKYQFILDGDRFYECSVCGRQVVINCLCNKERNASEFYPYCHCGAHMKGGAE